MAFEKTHRGMTLAMTAVAGLCAGLPACSPSPATTEVVVPTMDTAQAPEATPPSETSAEAPQEPGSETANQVAAEEPPADAATYTADSAKKKEAVVNVVKLSPPKVKKPKAAAQAATPKACCAGKNDCKGLGGCKTNNNACMGKNSCKGQGGCAMGRCNP